MADSNPDKNQDQEKSDLCFFAGPDPFFEEKKNSFLAAVYQKDGPRAEAVYDRILLEAEKQKGALKETNEKYLRQVQQAFRRFRPFLFSLCSSQIPDKFARLQSLIQNQTRAAQILYVDYPAWEENLGLEPWQLELVFANAITFQMTSGCSNYCRRCNEWALPRIRAHFSHGGVQTLLAKLLDAENSDLALYGASDPLDWKDSPHDLADILSPLDPFPHFSLVTKIPRGKEELLKKLLNRGISLSVSLTERNRSKIEALEADMEKVLTKQHDSKELLIPAGLDEDFCSVKPSITDGYGTEITPEGACIIIPTFTSSLHPFGHKKLPITRKTFLFPVKKLGRQALLVDYFKPLEVVGQDHKPFYLKHLLEVQVESILLDNGTDELVPPGMRSLKEYFSIFEEGPRLQRKAMTRSVMARLKTRFLAQTGYKTLAPVEKQIYRERIRAHLSFCNTKTVAESRVCAASFFLAAVTAYLACQPIKRGIIVFLIQSQALGLEKKYGARLVREGAASLFNSASFNSPPDAAWEIFRFYATALVLGCHEKGLAQFIADRPSRYDPVADRFVPGQDRNQTL